MKTNNLKQYATLFALAICQSHDTPDKRSAYEDKARVIYHAGHKLASQLDRDARWDHFVLRTLEMFTPYTTIGGFISGDDLGELYELAEESGEVYHTIEWNGAIYERMKLKEAYRFQREEFRCEGALVPLDKCYMMVV